MTLDPEALEEFHDRLWTTITQPPNKKLPSDLAFRPTDWPELQARNFGPTRLLELLERVCQSKKKKRHGMPIGAGVSIFFSLPKTSILDYCIYFECRPTGGKYRKVYIAAVQDFHQNHMLIHADVVEAMLEFLLYMSAGRSRLIRLEECGGTRHANHRMWGAADMDRVVDTVLYEYLSWLANMSSHGRHSNMLELVDLRLRPRHLLVLLKLHGVTLLDCGFSSDEVFPVEAQTGDPQLQHLELEIRSRTTNRPFAVANVWSAYQRMLEWAGDRQAPLQSCSVCFRFPSMAIPFERLVQDVCTLNAETLQRLTILSLNADYPSPYQWFHGGLSKILSQFPKLAHLDYRFAINHKPMEEQYGTAMTRLLADQRSVVSAQFGNFSRPFVKESILPYIRRNQNIPRVAKFATWVRDKHNPSFLLLALRRQDIANHALLVFPLLRESLPVLGSRTARNPAKRRRLTREEDDDDDSIEEE